MSPKSRPIVVGIAGGSASGKTSLARALQEEVGASHSTLLQLDSYYRELHHLTFEERRRVNFDHPDAFDWELLRSHVQQLLGGLGVAVPVYDYATSNRVGSRPVAPRPLLLVEGILVFWKPELRDFMDIKVFVDTPADLRLVRRIRRDTIERQRSLDSVLAQYEGSVRLMHEEFCEPTKVWADVIIPRGARNRVAVDLVRARLLALLHPPGERQAEMS